MVVELIALVIWAVLSAAGHQKQPVTAITHVAIVDVISGTIHRDQSVVVTGNRISDIFPSRAHAPPRGARIIDGRGKFLMPGLWDAHVHAFTSPESTISLGARATNLYFPQYLEWGVTGIRDMGGWLDTVMKIKSRVAAHDVLGPRIVAAGRLLGGKNPWAPASPHVWVITDADSAEFVVDSLQRAGVDYIKVHDLLTRDVYFAIARAAKAAHLPLVGHLRPSVTVDEAIDAGQVGFEHLPIELVVACAGKGSAEANAFYDAWIKGGWKAYVVNTARLWSERDSAGCKAVMQHMKERGVRVTPTMILRMQDSALFARIPRNMMSADAAKRCAQDVADWGSVPDSLRKLSYRTMREIVASLHEVGVPLLAGTDGPAGCLLPGWSLHRELENFVDAGLTPLEALRTTTIEPARFLGLADSLGSIEKGKLADLVLLGDNPLADIRNAAKVVLVLADGQPIQERRDRRR